MNLFAGQASFETVMQIIFAISWGFILTMAFYKSGNLIPCIIAHAMMDALSLYGTDTELGDWIYIGASILAAVICCKCKDHFVILLMPQSRRVPRPEVGGRSGTFIVPDAVSAQGKVETAGSAV